MEIYIIGVLITFAIVMLIEFVERDYHCNCNEIFFEAFWLGVFWPFTLLASLVIGFNYLKYNWSNK